jgi:ATP-binding cassette subfamily F protein 3
MSSEILDELKNFGSGRTELELRQLLGCFLFTGDDVFKKIKILSGGEKARVALAKTIISQANFLMLDEPTNHLDMNSVQMLIDALNKYEGSYVLVSHDRYFVSQTANKIWEIVDGQIKEFKGTYTEYEEWKKRMAAQAQGAAKAGNENRKEQKAAAQQQPTPAPAPAPAANKTAINKEVQRELQKQQKQFAQVESQLASLKDRKASLEASLGAPETYSDKVKFAQVESEYQEVQKLLDKANQQYEQLFEKIMELEANLNS